jgi:hypothetical protein
LILDEIYLFAYHVSLALIAAFVLLLVEKALKRTLLWQGILIPLASRIGRWLRVNPYRLDGYALSLKDLGPLLTTQVLSSEQGKKVLKMGFVLGSGQDISAYTHRPGFVSHALRAPEIVVELSRMAQNHGIDIEVRSFLDIDITGDERAEYNFICSGLAGTNKLIHDIFDHYGDSLKVRALAGGTIVGVRGETYNPHNGRYKGTLILCANPFAISRGRKRIVVVAGGIFPIGTIAALAAFQEYLRNTDSARNNKHDNTIPSVIVEGVPRAYPDIKKQDYADTFDVRNITHYLDVE